MVIPLIILIITFGVVAYVVKHHLEKCRKPTTNSDGVHYEHEAFSGVEDNRDQMNDTEQVYDNIDPEDNDMTTHVYDQVDIGSRV